VKPSPLPPLFFAVRLPTLLAIFWRVGFSRKLIAGAPHRQPPSFLIFRLDSLGDVVLTTPLFRALKTAWPKSRCTVVVQRAYKPLLVTNPYVDEVLTLPRLRPSWLKLLPVLIFYFTRLRKRFFDFAISPRWDTDEHLATFLCVLTLAASRVGYSENATPAKQRMNRGFDAAYDVCLPAGAVRHEVLRNLAIVGALGGLSIEARPEIHLTERDYRWAARLLKDAVHPAGLVALGIGARSPGRKWPLPRYAETVAQLAMEHEIQPVIVCSSAELGDALQLAEMLPHPLIVSGAPIRVVCAVLERCQLFLGNDSGCAHLAAAVNCATIVISRHPRDGDPGHFNSPLRFAPVGTHVRVLQPASGLDECTTACRRTAPHCIAAVSADEAAEAARRMLDEQCRTAATPPAVDLPERSRLLLHSHSAEAIRRAVESLRGAPDAPPV